MKTTLNVVVALTIATVLIFMIGRALDIEAAADAERVQQFLAK